MERVYRTFFTAGRFPSKCPCQIESGPYKLRPHVVRDYVRLIGFVGSDAELKTTKAQREYTVLSLATTASWKDKNGDGYIRRTEWHKLVGWGNLSLFAATLKKGAHVSVEGELRYREFVPKKQKRSRNGDQNNQEDLSCPATSPYN
jgi:single-strand DNA-binding protein